MINKRTIKEFFIITIGTLIVSTAVFFFMLPSHVSVGSGTALAMVISNFIPLPVSVITLILNIVLLILGFLLIGPEFGAKTIYCSILMPVFLGIYEQIFPDFQSITQDPFLDVLCYIFVVGIGLAILFRRNASSGGLDIVAKLMNKFLRMDLGKAMSLSGMLVALSSALVYDKKTVVISVIGTYLNGLILDHFIFGQNEKKRVCIISKQEELVRDYILYELGSGATIYEATGAYSMEKHNEIITIVDKQEYQKLMQFMSVNDPEAFMTVYSVKDVRYQPKVKAKKN